MKTIAQEIAELRGMTVAQLKDRYRQLWGREPKVRNRTWLWKRCAWKVQEQRLGGLSKVAKRRLEELIAEIDLPIGERQTTVTGALRSPTRAPQHQVEISERTADKVCAARRRGLWTGGTVPLGYDLIDKRLVVNPEEAERVRAIFQLYLDRGSLLAVTDELNRRGWTTKSWTMKSGEVRPAKPFSKQTLSTLLRNPVYIGKVKLKGEVYDGAHEPILERETWDAVQHLLGEHGKNGRGTARHSTRSLLSGLVRCGVCGQAMIPHHTKKGSRRYGYYVCTTHQKQGADACPGSRVAVGELEGFVVDRIKEIGRDPRLVRETISATRKELLERRPRLDRELKDLEKTERKLASERRNLLDAVAGNGSRSPGVFEKLGEVEAEYDTAARRLEGLRAELAALDHQSIDEKDLKVALASFEPVWRELFPAERSRILHLLIEEIRYDAEAGEVAITFRPGGVRALAREDGRETA